MKLKDQVVLVTGGNSGIGRAIALASAAEGARVFITGRDPAKGARVLAELRSAGGDAAFLAADLADEQQAADLVGAVARQFGRLNVVVNNAGSGALRTPVCAEDPPGERLRKVMSVNLGAAYNVAAHSLPVIKSGGGGSIVNISSTSAMHGTWGTYGIAKAAIEALTRALAVQGAPDGIRANAVSPGWVASEAASGHADVDQMASLFGRMGRPEEIARVVIFLASTDASFITGQTLIVDGGLTITDYPSQPWLDAVGAWRLFPHLRPK